MKTKMVVVLQVCLVLFFVGWTFADEDDDATIELDDDERDCMPKRKRPGNRPGGFPPGTGPAEPGGGGFPPGEEPPPGGFPSGEPPPGGSPPGGGPPSGGSPPDGGEPQFPYSEPDAIPARIQEQSSSSTPRPRRTGRRRKLKKNRKSSLIERIPQDCQDYHRKLSRAMRDMQDEGSDCEGVHDCLRSHLAEANRKMQSENHAESGCGPILMELYEQHSEHMDDEKHEDDEEGENTSEELFLSPPP